MSQGSDGQDEYTRRQRGAFLKNFEQMRGESILLTMDVRQVLSRLGSLMKRVLTGTWQIPLLCLGAGLSLVIAVICFCGVPNTSLLGHYVLEITYSSTLLSLPLLLLWLVCTFFFLKKNHALRILFSLLAGGADFVILLGAGFVFLFQNDDHAADNWRVPEGVLLEVPYNFWVEDEAPEIVKQLTGKKNNTSWLSVEPLPDGDFPRRAEHLERLAQEHPELLRELYRRAEILGRYDFIFTEEDDEGGDTHPWIRCRLQLRGEGTTIRSTDDITPGISHPLAVYKHDLGNGWSLSLIVKTVFTHDKESTTESMERIEGYTMQQFDAAFAALAATPTRETLDTLLPLPPSPSLRLVQGSQPGIYELSFFLPQDARTDGRYKIRAYEYESGEELSLDRQADLNPADALVLQGAKVLRNTHFMVYTGNWGQYYGSCWQVWFIPNKGEREKVCEQLFLMQGWMR